MSAASRSIGLVLNERTPGPALERHMGRGRPTSTLTKRQVAVKVTDRRRPMGSPRTQPDEALYRATTPAGPSPEAGHLLTIAAEDLRNHHPHRAFTPADRITLARHLTDGTEPVHTELLTHMPRVDRQTTRGEYSLILADVAKGL